MSAPARGRLTLSRSFDPITTERLAQAGVSLAQPAEAAAAPPFQHAPADAETVAHNQRLEAEWHAAPATLEATLRDLMPLVFNDEPPPLAVGIDKTLIELLAGEFEPQAIVRFLRNWVRRPAYLANLARGDVRRDLDGCPTEVPDAAAQRYAQILLARHGVTP